MSDASRKPVYATLYFRDPRDHAAVKARAEDAGLSVSAFMTAAALGRLPGDVGGVDAERARALEEEIGYWRERFERMTQLAQDMQAEILQLRQEVRWQAAARAAGGGGRLDAMSSGLAPRILKVLTALRSADGKHRVYTEAELREELGLGEGDVQAETLRSALSELFRLNLVEPARGGWRARG